ncbi:MAG TPA: RnfABCDGE type electron transport complex subunit D [Thermoguttaceae bacterium]|nr:RnfABCDGE type electron transport complex subunit D [Thermoguttaceae bacterium]
MAESPVPAEDLAAEPALHVAPSPHLAQSSLTTRGMMIDVLVGLAPVMLMAIFVFQWFAVVQIGLCTLACVITEAILCVVMGRRSTVGDYSAAVTGMILGMSLPAAAPWYVGVLASVVAIGIGKIVFGGLGHNLFNPAMVGRAFVMLSFASHLGASAYVVTDSLTVLSEATPLTIAKQFAADWAAGRVGEAPPELIKAQEFWPLFIGQKNGSLGETSALALLIGGCYLCARRAAAWQIPAGVLLTGFICAAAAHGSHLSPFDALNHLISGSFLFGAFFIATDPVTSPVTGKGKFLFGLGIGLLTVFIRLFSGYPEGIMFAVLLMNAVVPLINRWTIPRPLGAK